MEDGKKRRNGSARSAHIRITRAIVEVLESRQYLSISPTIYGKSSSNEGSPYTLNFGHNGNTSASWAVNWGDGQTQNISSSATSATHTYTDGSADRTISATATTSSGTYSPTQWGLDSSFGTGGSLPASGLYYSALQPGDGKLLALHSGTLSRYKPDGSIDTSFGTSGTSTLAHGYAFVTQSNGAIITFGADNTSTGFWLTKYTASGAVDTSFGGGTGSVHTATANWIVNISVSDTGEIAIISGDYSTNDYFVTKFANTGVLDSTFGGGTVPIGLLDYENPYEPVAAFDANGKILVGASNSDRKYALRRFNADGQVDTTFGAGTNHIAVADFGTDAPTGTVHQIIPQADGTVLTSGFASTDGMYGDNSYTVVVRFRADGTIDPTFATATSGTLINPDSTTYYPIAVDSNGGIILGGNTGLYRYKSDGTPDASFGVNGVISTDSIDVSPIAVTPDGAVLISGYTSNYFPILQRYTPPTALAVHVNNVAPTIVASGPPTINAGAVYRLNLSSSDPGTDTISSWTINWGDGNTQVYSGNPNSVTHVYNTAANIKISATAQDEDGSYSAAHWALDSNFGIGGTFAPLGNIHVGGDGKLLTIDGTTLKRYYANGTVDTSFGTAGVVTLAQPANAILVQPDGKIITLSYDLWLSRYTPAGVLDTTFGGSGTGSTHITADNGLITYGVSDSGKIAILTGDPYFNIYALSMYTSAGVLDTTFNGGSVSLTALYSLDFAAPTIAFDRNGKLLVGATSSNDKYALQRFNTNGQVDASFGTGADHLAIVDFGTYAPAGVVEQILPQADGTILTQGFTSPFNYLDDSSYVAVVRLLENGTVDTTFAAPTGGLLLNQNGNAESPTSFTAGGEIIVYTPDGLIGYKLDGTRDASFGINGILPPTSEYLFPGATLPDGSFLASTPNGVQRYTPPTTFSLQVNHAVPTLTASGPATINARSIYRLNLTASELGSTTISSWTINWGDGHTQVYSGNPTSVAHVYTTAGTALITATALDVDGTFTATVTHPSVQITAAAALPAGWSDNDIGSPSLPGGADFDGTTWTLAGGGAGIGSDGPSDQFNFASQTLSGDLTLVARATSVFNTSSLAKGGLMIRDGTSATAPFVAIVASANDGVKFYWRYAAGGATDHVTIGITTNPLPVWVKLTRTDGIIRGFYSNDGTTWNRIGNASFHIPTSSVSAGLIANAHNDAQLTTATFTNVSVTATPTPPLPTGWSDSDIGSPDMTGGVTFDGTNWNIVGGGTTIGDEGTADQLNFAYKTLSGDITLITKVNNVDGGSRTLSKAGVMLRANNSATSAFAGVFITPTNGLRFYYRDAANTSHNDAPAGAEVGGWVKLTRVAGAITAYYRDTNSNWIVFGSAQSFTPAGGTVLGGIAAHPHMAASLTSVLMSDVSITSTPMPSLPTGWTDADLGSPLMPGAAEYDGTNWTISGGGGGDIGGTANDQFNFASTSIPGGNATIIAQVDSLSGLSTSSKAGVMLRADNSAAPAFAAMLVTPSVVTFRWKATATGTTNHTDITTGTRPIQVKLVRVANAVSGWYSTNSGTTWTQVGTSQTVSLPTTSMLAGLAVTGHNSNQLSYAQFSNVSLLASYNFVPLIFGADSADQGQPYTLTLTTRLPSGDAITGWTVDWGDGTDADHDGTVGQSIRGNPSSVQHTYISDPGSYTIHAVADTASDSVTARPLQLVLHANLVMKGPESATEGDSLNYSITGPNANTAVWVVTNGTTPVANGSGTKLTFVADKSGNYTIEADTINTDGTILSVTTKLVVASAQIKASITGPEYIFKGRNGVFTSTVSRPAGVNSPLTYHWEIRDQEGNISVANGLAFNHQETPTSPVVPLPKYHGDLSTFLANGELKPDTTYTLNLTVSENSGSVSTTVKRQFRVVKDPGEINYESGIVSVDANHLASNELYTEDYPQVIAELPDGKILVAGRTARRTGSTDSNQSAFIARLNKNLTLDTTFGHNGLIINALSDGGHLYPDTILSTIYTIAVDPVSQSIVVAGTLKRPYEGGTGLVVTRYLSDGTIDPTFHDGTPWIKLSPDWGAWDGLFWVEQKVHVLGWAAMPFDMTILPDESILIGGSQSRFWVSGEANDFLLLKLNGQGPLAGTPDTSFGNNGFAKPMNPMDAPPGARWDDIVSYDARPNGNSGLDANYIAKLIPIFDTAGHLSKILFGGSAGDWANRSDTTAAYDGTSVNFLIGQYTADGHVDTSFGADQGKTVTNFPGYAGSADRRIIPTFNDYLSNIEIIPSGPQQGKILAVGSSPSTQRVGSYGDAGGSEEYVPYMLALARYMPDGTIDTSFGAPYTSSGHLDISGHGSSGGIIVTSINATNLYQGTYANNLLEEDSHYVNGVTFQSSDGKIILSATTYEPSYTGYYHNDDRPVGWSLSRLNIDGPTGDAPTQQSSDADKDRYLNIRDTTFGSVGDGDVVLSDPAPFLVNTAQTIKLTGEIEPNLISSPHSVISTADGIVALGIIDLKAEDIDARTAGRIAMVVRYKSVVATPSNLQAAGTSPKAIGLTWQAPAAGDWSGYEIDRAPAKADGTPGTYTIIGYAGQAATSYIDSDPALQPAKSYFYELHAVDGRYDPSNPEATRVQSTAGPAQGSTLPDMSNYALIDTVVIPPDGTIVKSGVQLVSGIKYLVRVSGHIYAVGPDGHHYLVDAEYINDTDTKVPGSSQSTSTGSVDVGVAIDSTPSVAWAQPDYTVDEGVGIASFRIKRVGSLAGNFTFHYSTAADTSVGASLRAQAGEDYTSVSGDITLSEGVSSAEIYVPITQHTDPRSDKTFVLNITASDSTVLSTAPVIIKNNVAFGQFSLSPTNPQIQAGHTVDITVTRTDGGSNTATVTIATSDGTARAPNNYTAVSQTLVFSGSETIKHVTISTSSSAADKFFLVGLSVPSGSGEEVDPLASVATVNVTQAGSTSGGTVGFDHSTYTFNQDDHDAIFHIVRKAWNTVLDVPYTITADTAVLNRDYGGPISGTVHFDAGEQTKAIDVPILDDGGYQPETKFSITLGTPQDNSTTPNSTTSLDISTATATINTVHAPGVIQFSSQTYQVSGSNDHIDLIVTRSGNLNQSVTVGFTFTDGTAESVTNYQGDDTATSLTFGLGVASQEIPIKIWPGEGNSEDIYFTATLAQPDLGQAVLGSIATTRINIIYAQAKKIQFDAPTYQATEGKGDEVLTVIRSGDTTGDVNVNYATTSAGGTAVAGVDYAETHGTLVIKDGASSGSISVPILSLSTPGAPKTFKIVLTNPSGGTLGGNTQSTVTIENDIDPATISFPDEIVVTSTQNATLKVLVQRKGNLNIAGSVSYATLTGGYYGTAEADTNYTTTSGTINFNAGDSLATIGIPILDVGIGTAKTFSIQLSDPSEGLVLASPNTEHVTIQGVSILGTVQFDSDTYAASQGKPLKLMVTRTDTSNAISVDWSASSGTAKPKIDYGSADGSIGLKGTVKFGPDQATATISIPISARARGGGQFSVELDNTKILAGDGSGVESLASPSSAIITIGQNQSRAKIQFDGSSYYGVSGNVVILRIDRTGNASKEVSAEYEVDVPNPSRKFSLGGAITSHYIPPFYALTSGVVTFAPGVNEQDVSVILPAVSSTITAKIFDPSDGATIGAVSNAVIENSGAIPVKTDPIQFAKSATLVNEADGSAALVVTRTGPADDTSWLNQTEYVNYTTTNGTATSSVTGSGADFTAESGMLTFKPGDTAETILIPITAGRPAGGEKTFTVTLSDVPGKPVAILGTTTTESVVISHLTDSLKQPFWGPLSNSTDNSYETLIDGSQTDAAGHLVFDFRNGEYGNVTTDPKNPLLAQIFAPLPVAIPALVAIQNWVKQSIDLSWQTPQDSDQDDYYRIERSTNGVDFEPLTSVVPGTTSYSDTTALLNTVYQYRIIARAGTLESNPSNLAFSMLVNHAPIVDVIGTQLVTSNQDGFKYTVVAFDAEDGKNLTYSINTVNGLDNSPAHILDIDGNGNITPYNNWQPADDQIGKTYQVTVTVTDRAASTTTRTFTLVVAADAQNLPNLTKIDPKISTDGKSALLINDAPAGMIYRWHVISGDGATIDDPTIQTPTITFTKAADSAHPIQVMLQVSRPEQLSSSKTLGKSFTVDQIPSNYLISVDPNPPTETTHPDPDLITSFLQKFPSGTQPSIVGNTAQTFVATAYDQFGNMMAGTSDGQYGKHPDVYWLLFDNAGQQIGETKFGQTVPFTARAEQTGIFTLVATNKTDDGYYPPSQPPLRNSITVSFTGLAAPVVSVAPPADNTPASKKLHATITSYDGNQNDLEYIWTADESGVGFTVDGDPENHNWIATFSKPGAYNLHLTVKDIGNFLSSTVDVQPIALTSAPAALVVTPTHPTVSSNGFVTLTASEVDQFGAKVTAQPSTVIWTISGLGSLVDPNSGGTATGSTAKYRPPSSPLGTIVATVHASITGFAGVDVPITLASTQASLGVQLAVDTTPDTITGEGGSDGSAGKPPHIVGPNNLINQPEAVRALINDPNGGTITWKLTATPQGQSGGTVLLNGMGAAGSLPGQLERIGTITPGSLPDGMYNLTLEVSADQGGSTTTGSASQIVQIRSSVKLGNLTLPVTDISQNVPGTQPITVSRSYDSQHSGQDSGLGYGWTLDSLTPALVSTQTVQYDFQPNVPGQTGTGTSLAWNDLIYISLPSGEKHTFAFEPIPLIDTTIPGAGLVLGAATYKPNFEPVDGSAVTLTPSDKDGNVQTDTTLQWDSHNGYMFKSLDNGVGYNPALDSDSSAHFGGYYVMTSPDGTRYVINASTGQLHSTKDLQGNIQTFNTGESGGTASTTPGGIVYSAVPTWNDTHSHITNVTTKSGNTALQEVEYGYDEAGNLIGSVVRQAGSTGPVQKTTYTYADRLVLNYEPTGNVTSVYAVIKNAQGAVWNGSNFVSGGTTQLALNAVQIANNSTQWYSQAVPIDIPSGTSLTVAYFINNTQVWSETRQWNGVQQHLMTGVIDGQGVKILAAAYDSTTNQLTQLSNIKGTTAKSSNGSNGTDLSETTTDPSGNLNYQEYDDHGNVIRDIKTVMDAEGKTPQYYVVTVSQYFYAPDSDVDNQGRPTVNVLLEAVTSTPFIVSAAHSNDRFLNIEELRIRGYLKTANDAILWASLQDYDVQTRMLTSTSILQSDHSYLRTNYSQYMFGKPQHIDVVNDKAGQFRSISSTINTYDDGHDISVNNSLPVHNPNAGRLESSKNPTGVTTYYVYGGDPVPYTGDSFEPPLAFVGDVGHGEGTPLGMLYGTYRETVTSYQYDIQIKVPVYLSINAYYTTSDSNATTAVAGGVKGMLKSTIDYTSDPVNGVATIYTYYSTGQVADVYKRWNEDGVWHKVLQSHTDYDTLGRVLKSYSQPDQSSTINGDHVLDINSSSPHTTTTYDANGQVLDTTDIYGGVTHNVYDASGHSIQTIYPDGTETRTVYDPQGRVIWQTDRYASNTAYTPGTGVVTQDTTTTANATLTIYDNLGRVIATERHGGVLISIVTDTSIGVSNIKTSMLASAGAKRSATSTVYDGLGRVVESINAAGLRTGTIYYDNGQVHYTGPLQDGISDKGTSPWYITPLPTDGAALTAYLQGLFVSYTTYAYNLFDGVGNYDMTTDARGHITKTYKDAAGRQVETLFDDGSFTQTLYSNTDQSIDGYFTSGSTKPTIPTGGSEVVKIAQRKSSDPAISTIYVYDAAGNLTDVYEPAVLDADPTSTTHGQTVRPHYSYGYDAVGNEITQTDSKGRVTYFAYDVNGNQIGRTLPGGEQESTTYDTLGRELVHTDFDGNTATYSYYPTGDVHVGMLKQIIFTGPTGSGKATQTVGYTYDALGRQHTITDASGTTTNSYDDQGGLIEEQTPEGDIHYVFDPTTGQHIETYTGNTETDYGYDNQGRLSKVILKKLNGTALSNPQETDYSYDAVGDKLSETLPNGDVTTYTYDDLNRLTDVLEKKGGVTLFSQHFILNDDGTRHSVHDVQLQTDGTTNITSDTTWTYDAEDRLTGETYTSNTSSQNYSDVFAYDLANNRISKTHTGPGVGANESIAYSYNSDDELTKAVSSANGETDYAYDSNGSQLTTINGSAVSTFTYDVRNKMVGYASGTTTASYVYNDNGNRVKETVNGTTTNYLTDDQNPTGYALPLEEKGTPTSAPSRTYVIGDHIEAKADASGTISYFLTDGHGSTIAMTSSSTGLPTAIFTYDAFGGGVNFTASTAPTNILFGGDAIFDSASGLYQHGDGTRGRDSFRFVEQDGGKDYSSPNDPITIHKYLYAGSDPLNAYDPSGHDSLSAAALGRAVHKKLGDDFTNKLKPFGVSGSAIVTILKGLGPLTDFIGPVTSRFPDLVDINPQDKEVFEIKPANLKSYTSGLAQLIAYIYLFNKLDPSGGWHEGNVDTYSPPPILTIIDPENFEDPADIVAVFPPLAGVITYSSIEEVVQQRVKNVAEAEEAEMEDEVGIDALDAEIGGF